MKVILFFTSMLISISSFASTAITLNGLSWKTVGGSLSSIQNTYASCGINGNPCDSSGWRWANQSEVNQLISDFFEIEFVPSYNKTSLDTRKFFNYFEPDYIETGSINLWAFSSNLISETNGVTTYGHNNSATVFQKDGFTSEFNPRFDGVYVTGIGPPSTDLSEWYWTSTVDYYPFSLIFVKGEYDPSLGITYPLPQVPLPGALYLFAPALMGFMSLRRKSRTL